MAALLGLLGLAGWAFAALSINVATLIDSGRNAADFAARMLPLDFPTAGELLRLTGQTMSIVICATLLSVVLSTGLAVLAAGNTAPHRGARFGARTVIVAARAVPDVVLATVFFRLFGFGALAGVLAMGLHSVGMVGKLYADAVEQIDEGPREAMRAGGAGRGSWWPACCRRCCPRSWRPRCTGWTSTCGSRSSSASWVSTGSAAPSRPAADRVCAGHPRSGAGDRVRGDHRARCGRRGARAGRRCCRAARQARRGLRGRGRPGCRGRAARHGIENEQLPRPGAELPIEFALLSFEGKLRAAGVTTVFHGISFEDSHHDIPRSVGQAEKTCEAIDAYTGGLVDHRILYRLDVRSPEALSALARRLDQVPDGALVSHEDHTPGQGQYAVREHYERYLMGSRGMSDAEAREHVDQLIADRDGRLDIREEALVWLAARSARIRLLGHDPSSAAEIAELRDRGCAVAEFPTTIEAAEAARAHGLPVVIGAPNILRGRSHNGNASGRDLVGRGLVTALVSDYLPSGLLAAAMLLAEQGLATLPAAIGLVTAGPAEVAGLPDRGRLEPGLRADFVLVEPRRPWPVVRSVLSSWGVW